MDDKDRIDEGLRLEKRGSLEEALELYRAVAATATDPAILSEAYRRQAIVHRRRSEWDGAIELARKASQIAFDANLIDQVARTLNVEGTVQMQRGAFAEARDIYKHILSLTEDIGIRGLVLQNLGSVEAQAGDMELARQYFLQSQRCFQLAGDHWGEAIALNNFGRVVLLHGNIPLATTLLEDAITAARRAEDHETAAQARVNLADAKLRQGEAPRARELAAAALEFFTAEGNPRLCVECLRLLGDIARHEGRLDLARDHWSQAMSLAQQVGSETEAELLRDRLGAPEPA